MKCPLCGESDCFLFFQDRSREFFRCGSCGLVFVPAEYRLSPYEEKIRYDQHCNGPDNQGYRDFLAAFLHPLMIRLTKGKNGLDFGSGPVPLLAWMFREEGFKMDIYDPYYADNPGVFNRRFDFIVACEVVEHLREPFPEFKRLFGALKPGGIFGIRTGMLPGQEQFAEWSYRRDLTHILFFSPPVLSWIAQKWNSELEFREGDITIFRKSGG